jgi:hypothetical protein
LNPLFSRTYGRTDLGCSLFCCYIQIAGQNSGNSSFLFCRKRVTIDAVLAISSVDFQAFLQQEIIPEASRRQVQGPHRDIDSGQWHHTRTKQLQDWLREQELRCSGRLHFQVHWLPSNASWLDQIEIWFSLLQRKCLQPNHFVSPTDLETTLNEYIAFYNQTAKPINWTSTVERLE